MKNNFLFLLLLMMSIYSISCKKDTETAVSRYYIKATINGSEQVFKEDTKAVLAYGDFTSSLAISAHRKDSVLIYGTGISLQIEQYDVPIADTVYKQSNTGSFPVVQSTYYEDGDLVLNTYTAGTNPNANPPLTITISHIDESTVSGTFSGEYFINGISAGGVLVTNGEFYLPVQ